MITISIINQKGGVAKTTTAHALATGLALLKNKRVLTVDLDPQASLTSSLRGNLQYRNVLDLFNKESIDECIQKTEIKNLDLLASDSDLSNIDNILVNDPVKNMRLSKALEKKSSDYDYCIIDTPPSLNTLTVNALISSDRVIITTQADLLSVQGIYQLNETIENIKEYNLNNNIKIEGILITRDQPRTNLTKIFKEQLEELASTLNTKVFKSSISDSVVHKENIALKKSIFEYNPNHKGAKEYRAFIEEVEEGIKWS